MCRKFVHYMFYYSLNTFIWYSQDTIFFVSIYIIYEGVYVFRTFNNIFNKIIHKHLSLKVMKEQKKNYLNEKWKGFNSGNSANIFPTEIDRSNW